MPLRRINRRPASASSYEGDDERPRRSDPDEERPRARSTQDDDGEDDGVIASGWGGYKRTKESMPSDFPEQFKVSDEVTLIKFLQHEPFATYKQHWADWLGRGEKLSYTCIGEDCPICEEVGQNPQFKSCFNIIDFSDPKHPEVKALVVGMTVGDIIHNYNEDETTGPIDRLDRYFAINMSGNKKGRKQTNIRPVKARDLREDFRLDPLDEDDIGKYMTKLKDASAVQRTDKATLRKVAEQATE